MSDRIEVMWSDPAGRLWDLRRGPVSLANLSGLRGVPFDVFSRTSPVLPGQVVTGWNAKPRPVTLALDIIGSSAIDWQNNESQLLAGLRPDRYGTLLVTGPIGQTRRIDLRLGESEDQGDEADPAEEWGSRIVVPMVADVPWWRGDSFTKTFENVGLLSRDTYPGPPFYFPRSSYAGETTVKNRGDVDAPGRWTFTGPLSRIEVEVDGALVAGSFNVPEGATLRMNTDPRVEALTLEQADGSTANVTNQLDPLAVNFRPIPPGETSRIAVRVFGEGTASVTFEPLYFRAW